MGNWSTDSFVNPNFFPELFYLLCSSKNHFSILEIIDVTKGVQTIPKQSLKFPAI
jgi:hypothetical protein